MSETVADVAEQTTESAPAVEARGGYWWGTGRRKSAVARVRIKPGDGKFIINKRPVEDYFTEIQDRDDMNAPLKATKTLGKIDVYANVAGGGHTGQAGAVLLGLARALKDYDSSLESALRKEGFLTVDARRVERKKYGQRGARRRFQFSKR
ncbi:MAG: 30S ribosomal protein S9 [Phycisphaeraceae bacterium]|nr:30S ribosomal protein S9 [Phycisphaeraceae bacterium]